MKKFSKIAVVILMLMAVVFAAAACNSLNSITIDKANMPQVVFVEGQDLDLSKGKLSVNYKSNTEEIALDSPDVAVTGYDKTKLGEQELTVSYKGKTTTITVKVVSRVVADKFEKEYLVGEPMDRSRGELIITRDDGTSYSVKLNDAAVTLEGFDSSAAALPQIITARHGDYTGTFSVNIYAIDEVAFTKPRENNYMSHETGLKTAGGYFALKGNAGKITKYVELTSNMVTGFDLSEATIEHRTTPLVQTLTASYAGKSFDFNVNISFSDVSVIRQRVEELSSIDWTGSEIPEITTAQGENALEAMALYVGLSDSDKAYLLIDQRMIILRPAAVYGLKIWKEAVATFDKTFYIQNGSIYLTAQNYEDTKADWARLKKDSDDASAKILRETGAILTLAASEFKNRNLIGTTKIGDYLSPVYNPAGLDNFANTLGHMVTLYDSFEVIPEDWTAEELTEYSTELADIYKYMTTSQFTGAANRHLYTAASAWRAKDDMMDIIYSYYYYCTSSWTNAVNALKNICLPNALEDIYTGIVRAKNQITGMVGQQVFDTTLLVLYYKNALAAAEAVTQGSNEMYKEFYTMLTFTGIVTEASTFDVLLRDIRTTNGGYYFVGNLLLGDATFEAYWDQYIAVMNKYLYDSEYMEGNAEYNNDIEELLEGFVALSPTWQAGFLISLNTFYRGTEPFPQYALDFSNAAYTYFVYLISSHYLKALESLPAEATRVFSNLLLALESYTWYTMDETETRTTNLNLFKGYMNLAISFYEDRLSSEQKVVFDASLGFLYDKYVAIYHRYDNSIPTKTELGVWQTSFDELAAEIKLVNTAITYINAGVGVHGALIAAFASADRMAKKLVETAPQEIVDAYYYEDYALFNNFSLPLNYGLYYFRYFYAAILTQSNMQVGKETVPFFDIFTTPALNSFLADSSYIVWTYLLSSETSPKYFTDKDRALAAMAAYRNLSTFDQMMFMALDNNNLYYWGVQKLFGELLPEGAVAAAKALQDFERVYILYTDDPDGAYSGGLSYLTDMKAKMAALVELYEGLTGADLTNFDTYLLDMYTFYIDKYAELDLE